MTPETCQFCNKSGNEWTGPSHQRAQTRYYRCDTCGHVWSVDRDVTAAPPAARTDLTGHSARRTVTPG
jgi:hypothetical protein